MPGRNLHIEACIAQWWPYAVCSVTEQYLQKEKLKSSPVETGY